jgi:hypothetical protein
LVFQRRLGDAAKKAISKLQVRTIKKGDKVTASFLCGEDLVIEALVFSDSQGRKEGRMGNGKALSKLCYKHLIHSFN